MLTAAPPVHPASIRFATRSAWRGAIAVAAMAVFYVTVVRTASGSWLHVRQQMRQDWPYLTTIVVGFGAQVAVVSELRRRRHAAHHDLVTGGAGASASAVGMVACCAHHLADLVPIVGAASAATFLTDYRVAFMAVGIAVNAIALAIAVRQLRHLTRMAFAPGAPR